MGYGEHDTIGICIDEYNCGEMKGRIYSSLREEPDNFNSVITLVKQINDIFDEGDFPQATMRCRGFGKKLAPAPKHETERKAADAVRSFATRNNIRGRKATFRVRVMFRQNASWQGSLVWVEKNREENFRSVLEMMMLIDSSFEEERAALSDFDDGRRTANM